MNEDGEKRVRTKRSGEVDRLSNLPESLLCQVLLNLPTKDVVKCSVLSSRWRNLWKYVPGLYLEISNFREHDSFVSFADGFLRFNSESWLQSFKIKYNSDGAEEPEIGLISRWINTVVDRKVKHLVVVDHSEKSWDIQILPTIYTCESLVFLKLTGLTLASPKFVSLPSLKALDLGVVEFADNLALETLISHCPVLESLFIQSWSDKIQVLRVCSQSLLSFTHGLDSICDLVGDHVVAIDAPRLKYLRLNDYRTGSYILNNPSSLVQADIDTVFNLTFKKKLDPTDLPKRNMIRNFLGKISCVKQLIIASSTLEVIYDYSRCEQLPLFRNLSLLRVDFYGYKWEMLPIFLESCPNLKSLAVGSTPRPCPEKEGSSSIISGPRHLLPSLEYVQIERPLKGDAMEMKLVSYLLENSPTLKKLALCLDDSIKKEESAIVKQLLTFPRLCSLCQVVVF